MVTAKLICVFVFAYGKIRFSYDAAQISFENCPFYSHKNLRHVKVKENLCATEEIRCFFMIIK